MKKNSFLLLLIVIFCHTIFARDLKPGFDKNEYSEMLKISAQTNRSPSVGASFYPERYEVNYRSPILGMDNLWELWISEDSVAVIAIRGTVGSTVSWMSNLYAAMVPAKGELKLTDNYTFKYQLAQNPQAAVHVGWLVSTGFLAKDILPKIDSCYRAGIKNFYITGHSQGGGIGFLMTSYLRNLQNDGELPEDIRFKTYCSAGPKPGNLYYAYEYETQTQDGWAYNVVNVDDCVPMLPFTVQTSEDIISNGPFTSMESLIREQPLPHKNALCMIYKKMDAPSIKAMEKYQKYLGGKMAELVKKHLEEYHLPAYYPSNNYVRAGNQYILQGCDLYHQQFSLASNHLIEHHSPAAYYFILTHNNQ